jgi:hypothetical protein
VATVSLTLAVSGCSVLASPKPSTSSSSRSSSTATTSPASPLARAQATHEYPPAHQPSQRATGPSPSAITAVAIFATAYINWNADTVSHVMRALATHSIGQARSAMQLAAAGTAQDYELRRGGIANSGVVKAIAPLAGSPNHFVVVTLERTTATNTSAYKGLLPAWHLTIATVTEVGPGKWVLSGWQPEN